jgi:hypothetical protein
MQRVDSRLSCGNKVVLGQVSCPAAVSGWSDDGHLLSKQAAVAQHITCWNYFLVTAYLTPQSPS